MPETNNPVTKVLLITDVDDDSVYGIYLMYPDETPRDTFRRATAKELEAQAWLNYEEYELQK